MKVSKLVHIDQRLQPTAKKYSLVKADMKQGGSVSFCVGGIANRITRH